MSMMKAAEERTLLFRGFLSLWGAVTIGFFGVIVGAVWGAALDVGAVEGAIVLGIVGAIWGAIVFQLTPTGGVIMENKSTVNYAVIALHGWFAGIIAVIGLIVWLILEVAG
jgi:hypothetical protein